MPVPVSISIRSAILLYAFLFTGGLALLITTFLSWRLGNLTADLHHQDMGTAVTTMERLIEDEFLFRLRALEDYATFPAVTQGALNPQEKQSDIVSFLSVLSARDGEAGIYSLLDFNGGIIHSTKVAWKPSAELLERAAPFLADQSLSEVQLLVEDGVGKAQLFVPVCPGGRHAGEPAEGLLIYEFPVGRVLEDLTVLQSDDIALQMRSLDGGAIWSSGDWARNEPVQRIDRFENLDLEIQVQFDDAIAGTLRRKAFTETLALLFLPALLVLGAGIWIAQRLLGAPLRRLEQATQALGVVDAADVEIPNTSFLELEQLNKSFLNMRREIHQRDRKLLRSNQELERFAYVAAHDLREPLRTISNMLGLLEEESGTTLEPELLEYIEMARTRSDHMQLMLADLLSMSRLHVDIKEEPVNLADTVGEAKEVLQEQIAESHAAIEVGNLPVIVGCPNLLALMFQNLLTNAMKFVETGSVPRIRIAGGVEGNRARVTVQDNGIGFKPEYAEKIFDAFTRLHSHQSFGGSGIGLALVRRIVDLHHGNIHAESNPGKGATFHLDFPVAPP